MVRLELIVHTISILVLMVTLYLLSTGAVSEEPAAVSVFLSLLAEIVAVKSSLPIMQATPLEEEVISHLKQKGNKERKSAFDGFLRGQLATQTPDATLESLTKRGILVKKKVSKDQEIYQEVKLSLRGRLG